MLFNSLTIRYQISLKDNPDLQPIFPNETKAAAIIRHTLSPIHVLFDLSTAGCIAPESGDQMESSIYRQP